MQYIREQYNTNSLHNFLLQIYSIVTQENPNAFNDSNELFMDYTKSIVTVPEVSKSSKDFLTCNAQF